MKERNADYKRITKTIIEKAPIKWMRTDISSAKMRLTKLATKKLSTSTSSSLQHKDQWFNKLLSAGEFCAVVLSYYSILFCVRYSVRCGFCFIPLAIREANL